MAVNFHVRLTFFGFGLTMPKGIRVFLNSKKRTNICLLYTSDAADE